LIIYFFLAEITSFLAELQQQQQQQQQKLRFFWQQFIFQ
jgi:hypothetical protein